MNRITWNFFRHVNRNSGNSIFKTIQSMFVYHGNICLQRIRFHKESHNFWKKIFRKKSTKNTMRRKKFIENIIFAKDWKQISIHHSHWQVHIMRCWKKNPLFIQVVGFVLNDFNLKISSWHLDFFLLFSFKKVIFFWTIQSKKKEKNEHSNDIFIVLYRTHSIDNWKSTKILYILLSDLAWVSVIRYNYCRFHFLNLKHRKSNQPNEC